MPVNKVTHADLEQFSATCDLDILAERFQAGDVKALFAAVVVTNRANMPMPGWVSDAFERGWSNIAHIEAMDLNGAFGRLHPPGTQRRALKSAARNRRICAAVERHKGDKPIDVAIRAASEECNSSEGTVRKIYYGCDRGQDAAAERASMQPSLHWPFD